MSFVQESGSYAQRILCGCEMSVSKLINSGQRRKTDLAKSRRGFALISSVFVTLFVSSITLSLASLLSTSSTGAVEDLQSQQAGYVADGGLHYILMKEFKNSSDFTTASTASNVALGAGQFSVTYANRTATAVDITVTSQVANSVCQIQQHVVKQSATSNALHSGANTQLTSSQSGGGTITGPSTYAGNFSSDAGYTLSPAATHGSAPAAVSLTALRALTTSTINGNYTVPNGFNGYVRVTGNVTISGTITMTGLIVADGNITISENKTSLVLNGTLAAGGNIEADFKNGGVNVLTAQSLGGQMQPLLLAGGNIQIDQKQNTTGTYKGLIQAGGNVEIALKQTDTMTILGGIVASGNVQVDSKQSSVFSVNLSSGSAFLPNTFVLSSWRKN